MRMRLSQLRSLLREELSLWDVADHFRGRDLRLTLTGENHLVGDWIAPENMHGEPTVKGDKPEGLWYACGVEWIDYLQTDGPGWEHGARTLISLDLDLPKMAALSTDDDIEQFTQRYGTTDWSGKKGAWFIDWPEVSKNFGGIEICPFPFVLSRDPRYRWLYSWSIASGCVWDPAVVRDHDIVAWWHGDTWKVR